MLDGPIVAPRGVWKRDPKFGIFVFSQAALGALSPEPELELPKLPGDLVEVHGLTSEVGKLMNGQQAVIVEAGAPRCLVRLLTGSGGKHSRVKLCNLRQISAHVRYCRQFEYTTGIASPSRGSLSFPIPILERCSV